MDEAEAEFIQAGSAGMCKFSGPVCGNGLITGSEACDDGNTTSGDGCSSTCTIESGANCNGAPSVCTLSCGNGTIEGGEQCDLGSALNGQATACCSSTCTFKPATSTCRATVGVCDVEEKCTGSSALCPSEVFQPSTFVCRPSTVSLDPAESCTGSSATCPPDVGAPPDTTAPDTSISSGPSGTIAVNTATFTWTGTDDRTTTANLQYAYRLDPIEANFSAFGSATTKSYSNLANGNYTLFIKARDQAGLEDTTPASQAFTVNVVGPTLTASPDSIAVNGAVTVAWNGVTNPLSRDWVALFRVGAANNQYLAWQYVSCSSAVASATGSCRFNISVAGTFEFRYFRNNGSTTAAVSNPVTVGSGGGTTLPTITVQATTPTTAEGGTQGQFTVTRSGNTTGAVTVNYTMSGGASNGTDYTQLPGSVTLAAGVTLGMIPVLPVDDQAVEGNESVVTTLNPNAAYTLGSPSSATVTITDNDTASGEVVLTVSPDTVAVNKTITVNWSGVTNASGRDWLGVYPAGATGNLSYVHWQYVNCSQGAGAARPAGSCTFRIGSRGVFVVRYMRNGGFTSSATSNPVSVQ